MCFFVVYGVSCKVFIGFRGVVVEESREKSPLFVRVRSYNQFQTFRPIFSPLC